MRCVVCDREIVEAQYANPFEKIRKLYPCCSTPCAEKFDPDVHWLPAEPPKPADDAEATRMMRVLDERLAQGDSPTVVVRDILIAGIPPQRIRNTLARASIASAENHARAEKRTIFGMISGLFTGRYRFAESRDKRDPKLLDAATASLDAWERHYASRG
jgi:hypothetical protein